MSKSDDAITVATNPAHVLSPNIRVANDDAATATSTLARFVPTSVVPSSRSVFSINTLRMIARRLLRSTSCRRRTRLSEISPVSMPEKNAEARTPNAINTNNQMTTISASLDFQEDLAHTVLDDLACRGGHMVDAYALAVLRQRTESRDHPAGNRFDVRRA